MDSQLAGYLELLRGVHGLDLVRTGSPATAEQLGSIERELGVSLPAEYKAVLGDLGYLTAGEPARLIVYGVTDVEQAELLRAAARVRDEMSRVPGLADRASRVVPLVRVIDDGAPAVTWLVDAQGKLHVFTHDGQRLEPAEGTFRSCLQEAMHLSMEGEFRAKVEAAGGVPDDLFDDEPGVGEATLQMHVVPPPVAAALKKEPGVADEITLYTSLAEFREQTVSWEKAQRDSDTPESKEMVRRMRSLLKQPGVAKLKELVSESVDIVRWADAIVICLGENAVESLALRGTERLPSDGTDTIHLLPPADVKRVAAVIGDSEDRLRAGYDPAALRARGLYRADAPNEAAFLEELCAMWDNVVEAIKVAAENKCGWLIRRTEG